jgi:uncharacterized protein YodC (DUF2158 family)
MNDTNLNPKGFSPGDVVALKSGSSRMTVVSVDGDTATVLWSDYATKEIHDRVFPLVALVYAT